MNVKSFSRTYCADFSKNFFLSRCSQEYRNTPNLSTCLSLVIVVCQKKKSGQSPVIFILYKGFMQSKRGLLTFYLGHWTSLRPVSTSLFSVVEIAFIMVLLKLGLCWQSRINIFQIKGDAQGLPFSPHSHPPVIEIPEYQQLLWEQEHVLLGMEITLGINH